MFIVRFLQIGPLQAAFFVHYLQKTHNISTPRPDTLLSITPGIIVENLWKIMAYMELLWKMNTPTCTLLHS